MDKTTLLDYTCKDFAAALAARTPTPGGGGACAYTGALAAALAHMSLVFSQGKRAFVNHEHEIQAGLDELERLQNALLLDVQKDAAAYHELCIIQKQVREGSLDNDELLAATCAAARVPFGLMETTVALLDKLAQLVPLVGPYLISDVGCAAALAKAALEGAYLSVIVNTNSYERDPQAQELQAKAHELLDYGQTQAQTLYQQAYLALVDKGEA